MPPFLLALFAQGLGLLGNAVLAKGKEVIEDKLGVDIEKEVQTPEGRMKLLQLQTDHEEFLLNNALENKKLDLQQFGMELSDTENARNANAQIQDSPNASWNSKNAAYLMDYLIVGGTIALAYMIFFVGIPPANRDIAFAAFGSMMTLCGTVVNFHRGTSRQSQTKNYTVDALAGALAKQTAGEGEPK
jgi:flagellar biosynthesis component FlhA